jgi:catechol 2,3-dioxygenase-like lactoylglutathione lyase family enzyme
MEARMPVESCIPVIPSADLEKSLRFWVDGLGFAASLEMRKGDKLIGCMLRKKNLAFWLNQRAGTPIKSEDYHGISLYWAPSDIRETREHLKRLGYEVSELLDRDYGQTEFFLTDDDGFTHCFGVATKIG